MWNFLWNICMSCYEDTCCWGAMEQIWVILDGWAPWMLPTSSLADTCYHHMGRKVDHFHNKIHDFLYNHVAHDFCCGDSKVIHPVYKWILWFILHLLRVWSACIIQFWVLLSIFALCILPSHFPKAMLQYLLPKLLITSCLAVFWLLFTIPKTCPLQ